MALDWFKMLQLERQEPLTRLYQGPTDPLLMRDVRRLVRMIEELVSEQVDSVVPPFAKIEQAYALWCRLRSYQQLWLSLSGGLRKDQRCAAFKNLSDFRPHGVQLLALMLNRLSKERDAPVDWVNMMRRRGWSLMPWRAAVSFAVTSKHDFDAAWGKRFELEQMLITAAGDNGMGTIVGGLRSRARNDRDAAIHKLTQIFQRLPSDFETIYRETASAFLDSQIVASRLDVETPTIAAVLKIVHMRSPKLAQLLFDRFSGSGGDRFWHDRYAEPVSAVTLSKESATKAALNALEKMHPKIRKASQAVIKKNWVHQPKGRGGGFTTPILFDKSGKADFGPLVYAPFDGDLQSLRTLAHELGHAAHAELSKARGPMMHDAGWAVSEFMALMSEHLVLQSYPDVLIAQDFHMLVHQPAIAEFENRLASSPISDSIDSVWISAMKDVYGPTISLDGYATFWRRHTSTVSNAGYPIAYVLGWALAQFVIDRLESDDKSTKKTILEIAGAGAAPGFEEVAARFGAGDINKLLHNAFDKAEDRLQKGVG